MKERTIKYEHKIGLYKNETVRNQPFGRHFEPTYRS